MSKLANIWAFIKRHKYWVTIGIFLLIIGVLDENSLIRRIAHKREIHQLNTEIERYRKQYEEDSKLLKEITSNKEALEKVARNKGMRPDLKESHGRRRVSFPYKETHTRPRPAPPQNSPPPGLPDPSGNRPRSVSLFRYVCQCMAEISFVFTPVLFSTV